MPTVPSTCVPVGGIELVVLPQAGLLSPTHAVTSSPTPDPDVDDVMLMQVENGMILEATSSQCPPQTIPKPHRIDLSSLTLHSPSSIVGTPFDASPRFEYPFPDESSGETINHYEPGHSSFNYSDISTPFSPVPRPSPSLVFPPPPSPVPVAAPMIKPRAESRSFSPTHLKLNAREPPMPPGLRRKMTRDGAGDSNTMISVMGFDVGGSAGQTRPSRSRQRSGSSSGRSDKPRFFSRTRDDHDPSGVSQNSNNSMALSLRLEDIRWKRHSLAICQSDRENLAEHTNTPLGCDALTSNLCEQSQGRSIPALAHSLSSMS